MSEKVYVSTGRGGAGNIKSSESVASPKSAPQGSSIPPLQNDFVTTGRGGLGNMVKNDNPELTRKLQDVDGGNQIHPVTSSKSFIGRGGYGNIISAEESNSNNLYAVTSNGPTGKDENKSSFISKVVKFFKGPFN